MLEPVRTGLRRLLRWGGGPYLRLAAGLVFVRAKRVLRDCFCTRRLPSTAHPWLLGAWRLWCNIQQEKFVIHACVQWSFSLLGYYETLVLHPTRWPTQLCLSLSRFCHCRRRPPRVRRPSASVLLNRRASSSALVVLVAGAPARQDRLLQLQWGGEVGSALRAPAAARLRNLP